MKQDNTIPELEPDEKAQLERLKIILASTQVGTWEIYFEEGKNRLLPDDRMKKILGFTDAMTPEEMFNEYETRVHPQDKYARDQYVYKLNVDQRGECTYRWVHPTKGVVWLRSGGARVVSDDPDVLHANGFLYDVTPQMTKEIRSNHIIKTFAKTYDFINYVNLEEDTFYTYAENEITDEALLDVLMAGTASQAISIGLQEIVCDEHRAKMTEFTDLSTINERMQQGNVLVCEYQDQRGVWYEFSYTVAERKKDGSIKHLLWAVRLIDSEKQVELRRQKMLEDNIAANKAKSKFLQNMSHEIRTPLNAMFGFSQLLGLPDGSNTDEERERYNTYIYNSYQLLDMLISDILDVADSDHGNYRISLSHVTVNSVCRSALSAVEFRVPSSVKAYVTTDFPDDFSVTSDSRRIQQVLINFLTNACKNTERGEIHLHCSSTENPGRVTFSVTDTGKGIPKEKAELIFNRFTKLDQYVQGSGLGLNICRTIADKLGGEVYLDTSYTDGARFVFVIGMDVPADVQAAVVNDGKN